MATLLEHCENVKIPDGERGTLFDGKVRSRHVVAVSARKPATRDRSYFVLSFNSMLPDLK